MRTALKAAAIIAAVGLAAAAAYWLWLYWLAKQLNL